MKQLSKSNLGYLKGRGFKESTLKEFGFEGFGNDIAFRFPFRDSKGFKIRRGVVDSTLPAKYINPKGYKNELFNVDNYHDSNYVIIAEGEFDTMVLHQEGYSAVGLTTGVNSLTSYKVLSSIFNFLLQEKHVIIGVDNDNHAHKSISKLASLASIERLIGNNVGVIFPSTKDWNEDLVKHGKLDINLANVSPLSYYRGESKKKHVYKDLKKDNNTSILKVLTHFSISTESNGMFKCYSHKDKTPSAKIYTKTNTFYCFGCGHTGDTAQVVKDMLDLNYPQALEYLKTI